MRSSETVSVVVCAFTWDRAERLVQTVESLRRQSRPPEEIVVVVDHCPALLEWVRERLDDVRAVANREPRGLAGARNSGVAAARGDVVAFIDDDAVAAPDWIERLLAAYADPAVVGVGGAALPDWETGRPRWLPEEFLWVVGCSYRGLPQHRSPVRNLIGCNMSFRREAIGAAGGFAHGLGRIGRRPLGCEETDLCLRLTRRRPGTVILYDPALTVRHHVPRERTTLAYFLKRCHAEGISKAEVARRAGRERGLASERAYVARTLPGGMRAGLAPAGAIVLGLAATAAGFAAGTGGR